MSPDRPLRRKVTSVMCFYLHRHSFPSNWNSCEHHYYHILSIGAVVGGTSPDELFNKELQYYYTFTNNPEKRVYPLASNII